MVIALVTVPRNWEFSFELLCDSDNYLVGAVISKLKEKILQAIHVARKIDDYKHEIILTPEKELLVVVNVLEKFLAY